MEREHSHIFGPTKIANPNPWTTDFVQEFSHDFKNNIWNVGLSVQLK
jgi:hypothetical protein